jgi:hypothetical protein
MEEMDGTPEESAEVLLDVYIPDEVTVLDVCPVQKGAENTWCATCEKWRERTVEVERRWRVSDADLRMRILELETELREERRT